MNEPGRLTLDDFVALPTGRYRFKDTGDTWPAGSVDARVAPVLDGLDDNDQPRLIKATAWLRRQAGLPLRANSWLPAGSDARGEPGSPSSSP